MKVIATVLTLWVASAVIAAEPTLKPPVPRPSETGDPEQKKSDVIGEKPEADKRGTDELPLTIKLVDPIPPAPESEAARKQHEQEAATNWWIAVFTDVVALTGFFQLVLIFAQARIAARQNKILENQSALMATMIDRPWLKAEPRITGPFKRSEDGNTISIGITVDVTNLGRSPATKVAFHVGLYTVQNPADFNKPLLERDAACANLRQRTFDTRLVVFPNDPHPYTYTVEFHADAPGIAPDNGPISMPLGIRASFRPVIGGCVDYQFAGSTKHHQTGFLYDLWWPDKASGPNHFHPFGPDTTLVAADEMELARHLIGGFYAD